MTRVRVLLLVLSCLLTVVGLGSVTAPAHARAGDPHYAEPTVGQCHDYTWKGFLGRSDPSTAETCDGTQSARTVGVLDVPKRIDLGSEEVYRYEYPRCQKAIVKAVGGRPTTRALAAYGSAVFFPTKAEQRLGAHWVRCDVVLYGGKNKLAPVPTSLRLGRPPLDDAVAKCLLTSRGHSYITVCERRHSFRSQKAIQLHGSRYPSQHAFELISARRCKGGYFVPPSAEAWKAGYKIFLCYAKTSR